MTASDTAAATALGMKSKPAVMAGYPSRRWTSSGRSATVPNSGLIVAGSAATTHRREFVAVANKYKLPVVYSHRAFVADGGLISYGPDFADQFRHVAGYVSRILRGEKPADLPVQAPTKNQLVINLKTAKAMGLTIPSSVLARADEIIK